MCQELKGLLWIGCLTELTWTTRFELVYRHQTSTRRHIDKKGISHVRSGTILSSSFVQHQSFQLSLLRSEFQLDWLHQKTMAKRDCGKIKAHGDEPDFHCLDKFLIREPSDCVEKPGDTQSIYRETWKCEKNQLQLRFMLADSRSDVGYFWSLDQRRNGTEFLLINQMENVTRLLNE